MSKKTVDAWQAPDLFEVGMGKVVVARQKASQTSDLVVAGVFLLDVYCLGVKNAFVARIPPEEWPSALARIFPSGKVSVPPACARKLILEAVAYARSLGLEPSAEYERTRHVLSGIDATQCQTSFTFGNAGKPFYIQGPDDSPHFVRRVLMALEKHAGPARDQKYHFLVQAQDLDPDDLAHSDRRRPNRTA